MALQSFIIGDFDPLDWDNEDWDVGSAIYYYSTYLFQLLPEYFHREDTYKDETGRGFLRRYLEAYGQELDEEFDSPIENYLDIIDVEHTDSKYLGLISDWFGNPPDIFQNEALYRNILRFIIPITKVKGSYRGYELFFSLLGFDIEIEELPTGDDVSQYDIGGKYDSGSIFSIYDQDGCTPCSAYNIVFFPDDITNIDLDQDTVDRLRKAISFNEPINAILNNLTYGIQIFDDLSLTMVDTIGDQDVSGKKYDNLERYDDGIEYDYDLLNPTIAESHIILSVIYNGGDIYEIRGDIFKDIPGYTLNLNQTTFNIKAYNSDGDITYDEDGVMLNPFDDGTYWIGLLVKQTHNLGQASIVRISGNVILTTGQKAVFSTSVGLNNEQQVNLYFI